MKHIIASLVIAVFGHGLQASAQVTYNFAPFDGLSNGKNCVISFAPTILDICGKTLLVNDVRGWIWKVSGDQINTQTRFVIYDKDLGDTQVVFLNEPTAERFKVQLAIWSGKTDTSFRGQLWK
jgi:hypothetical protein